MNGIEACINSKVPTFQFTFWCSDFDATTRIGAELLNLDDTNLVVFQGTYCFMAPGIPIISCRLCTFSAIPNGYLVLLLFTKEKIILMINDKPN